MNSGWQGNANEEVTSDTIMEWFGWPPSWNLAINPHNHILTPSCNTHSRHWCWALPRAWFRNWGGVSVARPQAGLVWLTDVVTGAGVRYLQQLPVHVCLCRSVCVSEMLFLTQPIPLHIFILAMSFSLNDRHLINWNSSSLQILTHLRWLSEF